MKLELYHRWMCPYSEKVRNFITRNNLEDQVIYKDVEEDDSTVAKLVELTGKKQVPCLVVDERPILESDDIISWMNENILGRGESVAT